MGNALNKINNEVITEEEFRRSIREEVREIEREYLQSRERNGPLQF